jgi:hypothetical protein
VTALDSLGVLVARHDSILVRQDSILNWSLARMDSLMAGGAIRDTIWVSARSEGIVMKDWISWIVTIAGITIAAIVTARGWGRAGRFARDGWAAAETTSLQAQEDRKRLDEEIAKSKLIFRIRGALETIVATARSVLKKDSTRAINPETMNGILVEWKRYERVADDLYLLGDPSLEYKIDAVIGFSRMVAEKIMEDERRFRETIDKVGTRTPKGIEVDSSIIETQHKHRLQLQALAERMVREGQALQEEVNRRWPATPGHQERDVPEISET